MKNPLTRIYHPYHLWEDYKFGFYGGISYPKDNTLQLYADLLKDLNKFEGALKVIISEWKHSCEHNLSNESMNRIAYLGQASCALIYNVPSSISMGGYNKLTQDEQKAADAMAKKYLDLWLERNNYVTSKTV